MRLGFKHFNIGKREFCITAYQTYDKYFGNFTLIILPTINFDYSCSSKSITLAWLLWKVELEDETYVNMGCCYEPEPGED